MFKCWMEFYKKRLYMCKKTVKRHISNKKNSDDLGKQMKFVFRNVWEINEIFEWEKSCLSITINMCIVRKITEYNHKYNASLDPLIAFSSSFPSIGIASKKV